MKDYASYLQDKKFPIFLFHGVIIKNNYKVRNYTRKHLLEEEFEDVIRNLRAKGNPVSMDEIVIANKENRSLPSNSYAITFDDGFANNFHNAAPILRRHQTPAMFYVTTDFVENNQGSWIDLIEYAVEKRQEIRFKNLCTCRLLPAFDRLSLSRRIR